ncbi:CATRA system-associated protein [Streptomyces sp. 4N509B]|uniref:CATRA system-associated protein n=1 Tax=Streptomyces sp. 4N509B TaxID=3457413 RepID=UPI003FD41CD8
MRVKDDGLRAEALDLLREVGAWRLGRHQWGVAERRLAAMADALARGEVRAFRGALYDLELIPQRAVRLEDDVLSAPPPVRERLDEIMHTLGEDRGPEDDDDDGNG